MTEAETFAALLKARFSCRGFMPDPVPRDVIEDALADAQHVASWNNVQPWQVIALSPEETAGFATALSANAETATHQSDIPFPLRYEGIYKERRRACGWQLYDAVGVQKGDRAASGRQMRENFRLFGAPNCLLVTTPKDLGAYGVLDCGAYVMAVMLALQARGVASIAMAAVASFAPFVRARYGIAEDRDLVCAVAFGYADPDHPANSYRTTRAGLDEVVDWR
ncbi:nitroreductase [Maliponia aquimaris]|uniref:Coenzyme F420:L-glutamate ligase n=1 Tax=Maliponia aquimaris TaxID=1673631 RepID=A0A238KDS1_9RHOB|nr:nitroreductase [Maliponia aquimaris]SMX40156.1 Coenzyme F420:L-glutamate ligase [Maliponia aquimaris]